MSADINFSSSARSDRRSAAARLVTYPHPSCKIRRRAYRLSRANTESEYAPASPVQWASAYGTLAGISMQRCIWSAAGLRFQLVRLGYVMGDGFDRDLATFAGHTAQSAAPATAFVACRAGPVAHRYRVGCPDGRGAVDRVAAVGRHESTCDITSPSEKGSLAVWQGVFDDGKPRLRLPLAAFGRQVHLRGLVGHRMPIEV